MGELADMDGSVENLFHSIVSFVIHSEDVFVRCFRQDRVRGGKNIAPTIGDHFFEQFGRRFVDLMDCTIELHRGRASL